MTFTWVDPLLGFPSTGSGLVALVTTLDVWSRGKLSRFTWFTIILDVWSWRRLSRWIGGDFRKGRFTFFSGVRVLRNGSFLALD